MGLCMAGSREGSHRANRLEARTTAVHTAEAEVAAAAGAEDGREAEVGGAMIVGEIKSTTHETLVEKVGTAASEQDPVSGKRINCRMDQ
mmetsp:Transcript_20637/g.43374  ORF Transcript_20637/g.43374 Transcript_20637/m.43374 type:complete len:89 (+) Transcript_20637:328-594(+)